MCRVHTKAYGKKAGKAAVYLIQNLANKNMPDLQVSKRYPACAQPICTSVWSANACALARVVTSPLAVHLRRLRHDTVPRKASCEWQSLEDMLSQEPEDYNGVETAGWQVAWCMLITCCQIACVVILTVRKPALADPIRRPLMACALQPNWDS